MEKGEKFFFKNLNMCLEGAEVIFLRKMCLGRDLKGNVSPPDRLAAGRHTCLMFGAFQEVKFVV